MHWLPSTSWQLSRLCLSLLIYWLFFTSSAKVNILSRKYLEELKEYYKVDELTLDNIAKSRNWIVSGSEPDIERTAAFVLKYFRDGKIGKFILDELEPQSVWIW